MKIPIYRAKKIDSDEYVDGYLFKDKEENKYVLMTGMFTEVVNYGIVPTAHRIDPSTLAIHFPDMLDSEGTEIFASLSEDGKGGDIINIFGKGLCCITFDIDGAYTTIIDNSNNIMDDLFPLSDCIAEEDIGTVTGIQQ